MAWDHHGTNRGLAQGWMSQWAVDSTVEHSGEDGIPDCSSGLTL